jgi:iron complex outermembrane receptor protein
MSSVRRRPTGVRVRALLLCSSALLTAQDLQPAIANDTPSLAAEVSGRKTFASAKLAFEIPAGPLEPALQQWADVSQLKLLAPSEHIQSLQTDGLSGAFTPEQALKKLLMTTRLKYELTGSRSIAIFDPTSPMGARAQSTTELPRITVRSPRPRPVVRPAAAPPVAPPHPTINRNSSIGSPPPYAGGQVATGGRLGLIGSRSVMDTPFNQTSYTAKTIQDQQARTIADVVANDPSVRVKTPPGNGIDGLYIRGFYHDSGDYALNGLYGIAPFHSTSANFVERVEVLKGPGALLNGMPPAGAIGGSINLVTKMAPSYDITQLTATYQSSSLFGLNADVSRRFGQNKELGIRFNGGYRKGATAYDRQTDEFGDAVLNVDYETERARFSVDVGYQAQDLNPPLRFLTLATTTVPPVPRPGINYVPEWTTWKPKDTFVTARGEVDVTKNVTLFGAFGYHRASVDYIMTSPTITSISGAWQAAAFNGTDVYDNHTSEAGVRATFDTGPVNHQVTVNHSAVDRQYSSSARGFTPIRSNLYNPAEVPFPASFPINANAIETRTQLSSIGFADTMSILDKRIQLIVGARRQTASTESVNFITPANNASVERSIWSPAFAAIFKPVENVSLYANYIEGLKAAEVVVGVTSYSNVGEILPTYQTKQKEVGVKVDFGRITATLSAFEINNPNWVAVPVVGQPRPAKKLSGEQLNRGVELYAFGELTPAIRVLGGVTYIDGEVVNGASSSGATVTNFSGKTPVGVSEINLNVGAEWDTPFLRNLTLTGRIIYTSEQFANEANTLELDAWTRVDVGARYTFVSPWNGKPIVVRGNIENVFNEAYWNAYRTVSNAVSLAAPRTYLVSTTFNF